MYHVDQPEEHIFCCGTGDVAPTDFLEAVMLQFFGVTNVVGFKTLLMPW